MKKVTYEFEVMDFCPERCEAFSPFEFRGDHLGCLHDSKCSELWKQLKAKDTGPTGEEEVLRTC